MFQARITDLSTGITYTVDGRYECRDKIDLSAYDELVRSWANDKEPVKCIQMGKVCVEKV